MTTHPLALEVGYDPDRRMVCNIGECWDFAASWGTVLEGFGEDVAAGMVVGIKKEVADYDETGRDLYRVTVEDAEGSETTRYYLVGARPFGIERDCDAVRDAEMDHIEEGA